MTEPEDRDISFEEAVEQCMRALGVTREQARAELRNAMLTALCRSLLRTRRPATLIRGGPRKPSSATMRESSTRITRAIASDGWRGRAGPATRWLTATCSTG